MPAKIIVQAQILKQHGPKGEVLQDPQANFVRLPVSLACQHSRAASRPKKPYSVIMCKRVYTKNDLLRIFFSAPRFALLRRHAGDCGFMEPLHALAALSLRLAPHVLPGWSILGYVSAHAGAQRVLTGCRGSEKGKD
jgi:hypothetical protein